MFFHKQFSLGDLDTLVDFNVCVTFEVKGGKFRGVAVTKMHRIRTKSGLREKAQAKHTPAPLTFVSTETQKSK